MNLYRAMIDERNAMVVVAKSKEAAMEIADGLARLIFLNTGVLVRILKIEDYR